MSVGLVFLLRIAAVDGLSMVAAFPTLSWRGPAELFSEASGREDRFTGGLQPSAPAPASGGNTVMETPTAITNYSEGVAYNSGNGHIYVTNYFGDTVSVISGTTVVATVSLPPPPPLTFLGLPPTAGYALLAGIVILVIAVGTVLVLRRVRPKSARPSTAQAILQTPQPLSSR